MHIILPLPILLPLRRAHLLASHGRPLARGTPHRSPCPNSEPPSASSPRAVPFRPTGRDQRCAHRRLVLESWKFLPYARRPPSSALRDRYSAASAWNGA